MIEQKITFLFLIFISYAATPYAVYGCIHLTHGLLHNEVNPTTMNTLTKTLHVFLMQPLKKILPYLPAVFCRFCFAFWVGVVFQALLSYYFIDGFNFAILIVTSVITWGRFLKLMDEKLEGVVLEK